MQERELENILQEKADEIETRDFSLVWDEIKEEVVSEKSEKKGIFKNKFFLAFAPALLAICIVLTPLFFLLNPPQEKIYLNDELILTSVTESEMFDGLSNASIAHVDLSKYVIVETNIYHTDEMEIKGACFIFYQETFFAEMQLYDKNVELNLDIDNLYDTNCKVNSADVYYKFKSSESGFYEYSVYATKNDVKYLIEYSGVTDNLMEFLNEFFA